MGKKKAKKSKKCNFASVKSTSKSSGKKTTTYSGEATPVRGLNNIGNTCFFNSALQALNAVLSYENLLAQDSSISRNGKVYTTLMSTLQSLQASHSLMSYNPGMLLNEIGKQFPHFKSRRQHDSHELVIALLSTISDEVVESVKGVKGSGIGDLAMSSHYNNDPILAHFAGQCGSIVTCSNCSSRSCSVQNCLDISLQIPGTKHLMTVPQSALNNQHSKKSKKKPTVSQDEAAGSKYSALLGDDDVESEAEDEENDDLTSLVSDCSTAMAEIMGDILKIVCNDANTTSVNVNQDEEPMIDILEPRSVVDTNTLSVYSCLSDFTSPEELLCADGNGYDCPKCSGRDDTGDGSSVRRDVHKRLLLVAAPPVLILHLKRLLPRGKCTKFISFPMILSIESYMGTIVDANSRNRRSEDITDNVKSNNTEGGANCDEFNYTLNAVVVHQGGALGGHYIAYVKKQQQWYYTSDTHTRAAPESEVLKAEAYMLYYTKVVPLSIEEMTVSDVDVDVEEIPEYGTENIENTESNRDEDCPSSPTTEEVLAPTSVNKVDLRWAKSLKPPELKKELQMRDLSTQGSKKELLARLVESSY